MKKNRGVTPCVPAHEHALGEGRCITKRGEIFAELEDKELHSSQISMTQYPNICDIHVIAM